MLFIHKLNMYASSLNTVYSAYLNKYLLSVNKLNEAERFSWQFPEQTKRLCYAIAFWFPRVQLKCLTAKAQSNCIKKTSLPLPPTGGPPWCIGVTQETSYFSVLNRCSHTSISFMGLTQSVIKLKKNLNPRISQD